MNMYLKCLGKEYRILFIKTEVVLCYLTGIYHLSVEEKDLSIVGAIILTVIILN